jgi:hypothetical protein
MKVARPASRAVTVILGVLLAQLASASIFEQSYIYPERAGKNKVRWRNFDWKYVDFLVEQDGQGGVRLYYYDREREAAELAAASITQEYQHLKNTFGIIPDIKMPYILFASHLEFEEQNLFNISESILGVTSPQDLTLSLPYWGEYQRFVDVSRHEMAHQFTIQKAYQVQRLHKTRQNPLERLPLWYIEGMAEYSAHRGFQDEVAMYVADLLLNPDEKRYHKLYPFWHDEIRNFVQTYRMGQVRVGYLVDRFGWSTAQNVLGKSYLMLQRPDMEPTAQIFGFQSFLEELTAMKPKTLDEDFQKWLREKFDIERLENAEELPKLEELKAVSDTMDVYTVSRDGNLVMYRDVDITTGRTRLWLVDLRDERSRVNIIEEGRPGIESLHFFQRRVFDLDATNGRLAFTALDKGHDVLYVQELRRTEHGTAEQPSVRIEPGSRRKIELKPLDILEAGDLALSPDGRQLAFVGLTSDGRGDVYIFDLAAQDAESGIRRVTTDFYAEKDLDWGPSGILMASDRTPSGHYNVFLMDPATGQMRQLTSAEINQEAPAFTPDGDVLYSSFAHGKSNVYRISEGQIERLTDTHTGLFMPREVPSGMLVRKFFRGRFRLFKANRDDLKPIEAQALTAAGGPPQVPAEMRPQGGPSLDAGQAADTGLRAQAPSAAADPVHLPRPDPVREGSGVAAAANELVGRILQPEGEAPFPRQALGDGERYKSSDLSNWRADIAGAAISTAQTGGLYLAFSDRMRDQSFIVDVAILGDLQYTQANLLYVNRKQKLSWGVGALHNLKIQRDTTFSDTGGRLYLQREFGAYGIANHPFDRFTHVQLGVGLTGVHRFNYGGGFLYPEEPQWEQQTGGTAAQLDLSLSGGYDTVGYHYATGPLSGTSVLGKLDYSFIPERGVSLFAARTDLQRYTRIWRGVNFLTRAAAGISFGDRRFRQQYFISSYDNLRGFQFGDERLLGYHFAVANAELQVPLISFFPRVGLAGLVEGVVGFDLGSVFNDLTPDGHGLGTEIRENSSAAFVLGSNFLLGPFVLRLHFAKPLDVGGYLPNQGEWQTNFSMRYAFM